MNNKLKYSLLLILPVLLFISAHILKVVQGPYYLNFYDPSYVYLINSLNLSQLNGYGVGHFDHPGTTVQVLGAIGIKIFYLFSNGNQDVVTDVLSRPESYLFFLNKLFVFLNCIVLFFLGFFTFKITGNILLSILIQLSPFVSTEIFYGLIIVTPENILIFFLLLFISSLVYYLFRVDPENGIPVKLMILWGIICGGGLVTKLNFVPVILIPFFLIKGIKGKSIFTVFFILTFFLLFSPALSNFGNFLSWIEKLFINNGQYGKGEATIINESTFLKNIGLIFIKDKLFLFSYIFCIVTLLFSYFKKDSFPDKESRRGHQKKVRLLILIFISMNIQILIVAKHYAQYYMIPSFMITAFSILLSSLIIYNILLYSFAGLKLNFNPIIVSMIFVISIFSLYKIVTSYYEGEEQRKEAEKIVEYVNSNYSQNLLISGFGSANLNCALAFAAQYAAGQRESYNKIILQDQKPHIFYNPWIKHIYSPSEKDKVFKTITESRKVIFQINAYGKIEDFVNILKSDYLKKNVTYKKMITNGNGESIYEIEME